jgi:carboxyl-terminal processing protease
VRWLDRDAGIGYACVAAFQRRTADELDEALADLAQAAPLRGLVLDLRGNSGGLLESAVALANRFLRSGNLVSLRRRNGTEVRRYDADPALATHGELPLALLVDGRSASSSEVVAGALQDHRRATLVGTRTFGKGVVQSIYRWEDLDFRLKLTTSHYYTPSGRSIEGRLRRAGDGDEPGGLQPDEPVPMADGEADGLHRRLQAQEIPAPYKAAAKALAAELGFAGEHEPPGPDADPQLARALAVLRGRGSAAGSGERR